MKIPATIQPEHVVAVIDSREQLPLILSPLNSEVGTLPTGDYSIRGLENLVVIERKSESDLLGCCGVERARFDREVQRLLAYPHRCLVVESTWPRLEAGQWRSKITSNSVIGSLLGWIAMGLPVVMCDSHERCGRYVARFLYTCARRRYQENRTLMTSLETKPKRNRKAEFSETLNSFVVQD